MTGVSHVRANFVHISGSLAGGPEFRVQLIASGRHHINREHTRLQANRVMFRLAGRRGLQTADDKCESAAARKSGPGRRRRPKGRNAVKHLDATEHGGIMSQRRQPVPHSASRAASHLARIHRDGEGDGVQESDQLNIEHHDHNRASRHAVVPMAATGSCRPVEPAGGGDAAGLKVFRASNAGTRNSR